MTSDLSSEDIVVCITSPQIITSESIVTVSPGAAGARAATATATVELGRRLLLAARAGDTRLVLELMAKGAPFTTDWLGTSPLHLAASNAHADTCSVLLRAGFSRDARTKVQRTPLHVAACAGHATVTRLLLAAGAAPDARDMLRMTPLHWAAQRGHAAVAAELMRRGADPHALSKFRKTPIDIAVETRRDDLVKLMEDAVKEREAAKSVHALVHEQMPETPSEPHLIFDTVQRLEEIKQAKPKQTERKNKMDTQHIEGTNLKRDDLIKIIEDAIKERAPGAGGAACAGISIGDEPMAAAHAHAQGADGEQRAPCAHVDAVGQGGATEPGAHAHADGAGAGGAGEQLLRSHGITLLPADDGSTVLSALQSGRTVVLSDAGKLMLKESSAAPPASPGRAAARHARAGLKLFALNRAAPLRRAADPRDLQMKLVQLPADAKIISPSKLVGVKPTPRVGSAPAIKIIMNKSNFNKLIANSTKPTQLHAGHELGSSSKATEVATSPPEAPQEADNVVCIPEEFLRSTSPRYLRTQLVAAHRALARLRADLRAARARLAKYEPP